MITPRVLSAAPQQVVSAATNYTVTAYNSASGSQANVNITVTNALLSSISLTPASTLTPVTGTGFANYTAAVVNTVTSVTVTPTVRIANTTITVNGASVASGAASAGIALSVGPNTITIVATAPGGATSQTYIITDGRGASVANLSSIKLTPASTLTNTGTSGTTTTYTTSVSNATASVTLIPTAQDANAKIKVNGTFQSVNNCESAC